MAANYVLLEKITVGAAGASSVTFSGIPQTGYTDLVVKVSCRSSQVGAFADYGKITFNGSSSTFSYRDVYGNGSSASSTNGAVNTIFVYQGNAATASTFGNAEIYIPNYTSSNNKSFSIDTVVENNGTTGYDTLTAGLWSTTTAINSVGLAPASGTWLQGSTFYLYGVAKLGTTPAIVPYATGGDTIMTDGTYWYHTFISSGTFTPAKALSCDYLIISGGGAGGWGGDTSRGGGGGGAGGMKTLSSQSLTTTGYTVTIGAGGSSSAQGTAGASPSGSSSSFNASSTTGGGGGAAAQGYNGGNGGSGGGNGGYSTSAGTGVSGEGFAGFASTGTTNRVGSGGGGKGAAATGQAGGTGATNAISGTANTYATGGTGGNLTGAAGSNGTANTGNGGNGGDGKTGGGGDSYTGGNGGSGLIVVRYAV
jgi:hypothetical protein